MWLKIAPSGIAEVRLLWGNEEGPHESCYHIGLATLTETCQTVRLRLEQLVRASSDEDSGVRKRALRNLGISGTDLYYVLFDASEGKAAPSAIKSWMTEQYLLGDTKLRITGHPAIHVPWALTFDADVSAIPLDVDALNSFNGFWGLKYALSSTLSGYSQPRTKLLRTKERLKLLSLVNHDVASLAYEDLNEETKNIYKDLITRPVGIAHDIASCGQLIEKAVSYDTILHFFGHQSDGLLDLGCEETISIVRFKMMLDRLTEQKENSQSYSLVILNACESVTGKMDYSFTNAADRPGLCGVIGTEAVVPRNFAALFVIKFLTLMLIQGKSVGEAMSELRHEPELWPLSLVYGCYAQPDYRIGLD